VSVLHRGSVPPKPGQGTPAAPLHLASRGAPAGRRATGALRHRRPLQGPPGDEKAIERAFAEDTRGLRRPAYFRFILTVDNRTAERFARLDGTATERVIRDAVQKTFRGAARDVQGVFAIHQHGGHDRPSHPHVHALLSPRLQNGAPIHFSPRAIHSVNQRWEMEVLRGLESQERRLVRREPERELTPLTPLRLREFRARQPRLRFERRARPRRLGP
jgi:hypothetical protein